jgi:hypothetical protein
LRHLGLYPGPNLRWGWRVQDRGGGKLRLLSMYADWLREDLHRAGGLQRLELLQHHERYVHQQKD